MGRPQVDTPHSVLFPTCFAPNRKLVSRGGYLVQIFGWDLQLDTCDVIIQGVTVDGFWGRTCCLKKKLVEVKEVKEGKVVGRETQGVLGRGVGE